MRQKDAIGIAQAIHNRYGTECAIDQLAAALNQSAKSGAFRLKVASARLFGITENERGKVRLTDLGREIVDPAKRRRASSDAFLNVPLFKAIFEKYLTHNLPPALALERVMADLGVSKKQTARARQALERSADQAGYFESGRDRLVKPGNLGERSSTAEDGKGNAAGGRGGGGDEYDPFIHGLLNRLPKADSDWSMKDRVSWLQTAENVFKLIYKGAGEGSIKIEFIPSEQKADERGQSGGGSETR
jgi:hypothetical protein